MKYDLSKPIDRLKAITAFKNHLDKGSKVELKKTNPLPPSPHKIEY